MSPARRLFAKRQAPSISVWECLAEELSNLRDDADLRLKLKEFQSLAERTDEATEAFRQLVIRRLHAAQPAALCFSGGGIRSATFGLGVLQALAAHSCSDRKDGRPGLLREIDYLSTVSGGGYLGGWFSAWAARAPSGAPEVIEQLASHPQSGWEPEPDPLRQLRRFANYLDPKLGMLSADAWTLAATVVRNILLNWLVLLPLIAAVLVLPRILLKLVVDAPYAEWGWMVYPAAILLASGVAYMITDLPSAGNAQLSQTKFLLFGLGPVVLSSIAFLLYWASQGFLETEPNAWGFMLYGIAIMAAGVAVGIGFAVRNGRKMELKWALKGSGFAIASGAIGGMFAYGMTWAFTAPKTGIVYSDELYTWLALPALLGVFALCQWVLVGLSSTITGDEDREWFARATAWILIAMTGCLAFTGIALLPPMLGKFLPGVHWHSLFTIFTGWIAAGMGHSVATPATQTKEPRQAGGSSAIMQLASKLVMPVFLVSLLALMAVLNESASRQITALLGKFGLGAHPDPAVVECLLAALLALPALLLSRFIDANKFSLHAMYRSRLIRTFLGASNRHRTPNPFTGFDPADNLRMTDLCARPLHVVNMTLNLVKSDNLAWQQRKGEPFTSTKYRSGSCRVGYQKSATYLNGVTLGGAIAVSGAAANPNMGYSSSPLLSIIMMLFNARLGAWLPNPGEPGRCCWTMGGPTFSVQPFIDEAFGLTTDKNAWVNVSDGGHFENLGLYEMVLRRCSTIIAVDGSDDGSFHFDDLGNAIRKIYVDMGIAIEFPDGIPIFKEPCHRSRHCAIGRIRYAAVDGNVPDGTLIYIKSSMTGNESEDVRNYSAQNPSFPHQSTADQWFDESQFESYRRLGYHVVEEILQFLPESISVADFRDRARSYCAASRAVAAVAAD